MKRIAQLCLAMVLVGTACAQTSLLEKIKGAFSSAPQPKPARNASPAQSGKSAAAPVTVVKPGLAKPAAASAAPVSKTSSSTGAGVSSAPSAAVSRGSVKPATSTAAAHIAKVAPTKISVAPVAPQPKQGAQKAGPFSSQIKRAKAQPVPKQPAKPVQAADLSGTAPEAKEKRVITSEGRRDPFLSPVVNSPTGPGCSTGKRCLAIDQIIVRGVVKSDTGMIAVVVNAMNKAYFLKENDPVFNGYVMKITGDSVVFKETYQDKLGKEFTREVVKKLTTPAV